MISSAAIIANKAPLRRIPGAGRKNAHDYVYVNVNFMYITHITWRTKVNTVSERTYTISELAKEFGVTTRTIRFYEEKGMISPLREGQKRLYTLADRVRIKLILRGKRIGMSLQECVEFIDMYDPEHNNTDQLHSLIADVKERRAVLLHQKKDIDAAIAGLDEVQSLCERALAKGTTAHARSNPEQS